MTLEEIKEKFDPVWKQIQDFILMGSKEEGERFKRKVLRLEQESVEKVKITEEVPEEKLKEMMQLILVEKHLDREDLNQLWALVKETLNIRLAVNDKEKELWELEINMLKAKVKLLEDREGVGIAQSGDNAPIKGRSLDVREKVAEKGSNDTEEMINVLTSMDTAIVLSSRVAEVPTGSGSIPTAGPPAAGVPTGSDVVPTVGPIFATATMVTPYIRRKGKEKMIESETPKKKKIQEQMDIQMARQLEEEMEREA
nr:hypothetical protein [Tanacetum cinerariifolium]